MVEKLLQIYRTNSDLVKDCFGNHFEFRYNLNKAFQESINSNLQEMLQNFSIPFMLANFTINCLKHADKKFSDNTEEETEQFFKSLVSLLSCVDAKDKYLHYLSKMMSKRLLNEDFGGSSAGLYWDNFFVRSIKSQVS